MTTPSDDRDLAEIAEAIADDAPIEWPDDDDVATEQVATRLDGLRRLEAVATAYRELHKTPTTAPHDGVGAGHTEPLFRWGGLDVLELIGEGSFGEVYRAFDPMLDREVALKLRREERPGRRDLVAEARRLARIRHPNVVTVHGVDERNGRIGLWTDLIDGCTLTELVRRQGPLGAREAAALGIDLCGALAAVHAAGLIHGDIKPSNIMRERGGRVVLMDFGAGVELTPDGSCTASPTHGTPIVMPPELLAGESASPVADIYSMGVVLYFMVTGHYPVEASCLTELLAKKGLGDEIAVSDHRPDLPASLVALIGRATAADPTRRFPTAGSLRSALAEFLAESPADKDEPPTTARPSGHRQTVVTPTRRRRWPLVTLAAAVVVISGITAIRQLERWAPEPAGLTTIEPTFLAPELRLEATLYRDDEDRISRLVDGDSVRPGDRLFLEVESGEPVHLYVLNEDLFGHVYVLFPVPGLDLANPLPANRRLRVPGAVDGAPQDWVVTSAGGQERFMVVAARRRLPEVEQVVARFDAADAERQVDMSRKGPAETVSLRGVGGLAGAVPGGSRLAALRDRLPALVAGEPLWVDEVVLDNPAP